MNIYVINAFDKIEWNRIFQCPETGDETIQGLYTSAESAVEALTQPESAAAIFEERYNYVLIQECAEGYRNGNEYLWFKYNPSTGIYDQIRRPSKLTPMMSSGKANPYANIGLIGHH